MIAERLSPTARQLQVFAAYCSTGSRKGAARLLCISETAVATQMSRLFARLGVADPFGAARALGWLVLPDAGVEARAAADVKAGRRWLPSEREDGGTAAGRRPN